EQDGDRSRGLSHSVQDFTLVDTSYDLQPLEAALLCVALRFPCRREGGLEISALDMEPDEDTPRPALVGGVLGGAVRIEGLCELALGGCEIPKGHKHGCPVVTEPCAFFGGLRMALGAVKERLRHLLRTPPVPTGPGV